MDKRPIEEGDSSASTSSIIETSMDQSYGSMDTFEARNVDTHSSSKKSGLSFTLILTAFMISVGAAFHNGYQLGCVNAIDKYAKDWIISSHHNIFHANITKDTADIIWSTACSLINLGGVFGCLVSGYLVDKLGRRGALLFNNIFTITGTMFMTGAKYVDFYPILIVGRFIMGIATGIGSSVCPIYLTEIPPIHLRGAFGSLQQFTFVVAILISQVLGLPYIFGSATLWPWVFGFSFIPIAIQLILIPFCPESPKYDLIVKKNFKKAEYGLSRLRKDVDVKSELYQMITESEQSQNQPHATIPQLFDQEYRHRTMLSIVIMCSLNLCGINAVYFYSNSTFTKAGLTGTVPLYATIGVGVINCFQTWVSSKLVDHPKVGRRILQIVGMAGALLANLLLVGSMSLSKYSQDATIQKIGSYESIMFMLFLVVSYATGPGPIPWFYVSEIYPTHARGAASALGGAFCLFSGFLVGIIFSPLENAIGQFVFLVFVAILSVLLVYIYRNMVETKGKTVEQVEEEMKNR